VVVLVVLLVVVDVVAVAMVVVVVVVVVVAVVFVSEAVVAVQLVRVPLQDADDDEWQEWAESAVPTHTAAIENACNAVPVKTMHTCRLRQLRVVESLEFERERLCWMMLLDEGLLAGNTIRGCCWDRTA